MTSVGVHATAAYMGRRRKDRGGGSASSASRAEKEWPARDWDTGFGTAERWAKTWRDEWARIGELRLLSLAPVEIWGLIISFDRRRVWYESTSAWAHLGISREFDLILRLTRRHLNGSIAMSGSRKALEIAAALSRADNLEVAVWLHVGHNLDIGRILRAAPNNRQISHLSVEGLGAYVKSALIMSEPPAYGPLASVTLKNVVVGADVMAALEAREWVFIVDPEFERLTLPSWADRIEIRHMREGLVFEVPTDTSRRGARYGEISFGGTLDWAQNPDVAAVLGATRVVRVETKVANLRMRGDTAEVSTWYYSQGQPWEIIVDAARERDFCVVFDALNVAAALLGEFLDAANAGLVGADFLVIDRLLAEQLGREIPPVDLPPTVRAVVVVSLTYFGFIDIDMLREQHRKARGADTYHLPVFRVPGGRGSPRPLFIAC